MHHLARNVGQELNLVNWWFVAAPPNKNPPSVVFEFFVGWVFHIWQFATFTSEAQGCEHGRFPISREKPPACPVKTASLSGEETHPVNKEVKYAVELDETSSRWMNFHQFQISMLNEQFSKYNSHHMKYTCNLLKGEQRAFMRARTPSSAGTVPWLSVLLHCLSITNGIWAHQSNRRRALLTTAVVSLGLIWHWLSLWVMLNVSPFLYKKFYWSMSPL